MTLSSDCLSTGALPRLKPYEYGPNLYLKLLFTLAKTNYFAGCQSCGTDILQSRILKAINTVQVSYYGWATLYRDDFTAMLSLRVLVRRT